VTIPKHILDAVAQEVVRQAVEDRFYGQDDERTKQEVRDATERALLSGAEPPLEFAGMGMTGTVLCDARGHAFKVPRTYGRRDYTNYVTITDEADWLATASKVPGVREHVARFIAFHPETATIERECVQKTDEPRGTWGVDLGRLHSDIGEKMKRAGWGPPEFKEDSYVETKDRGHVLVDAGFALRKWDRLADYVQDILDNRRDWRDETPKDLAWALRMEFPVPRPAHVMVLLERLKALPTWRE
jgi:hypothetical protein